MASIMEQHQGVSQGRRRARKKKRSLSKDKSKERWRTLLTDIHWSRCLNLLLLFCFINSIGSAPAGNSPRRVTGEKGDNITLPCEFQPRDDSHIALFRQSKNIIDCQNEECSERFVKKGSCDIIIKDLIFSDAGKYILKVYNTDGQIEVERDYHLHIQGEISVKTGEQLKMDVLVINADKVEKNSSGEWTEVWTRGHGVSSDRLTDRDGNLIISNFTVSDTGTYRVLDSEGEIWITVTVTGSKDKLNTDQDTEQHKSVIIVVCVIGALLVLVISALIWKRRRQHRNREHESVPMEDIQ
ncbi:uncharacterized protein LOC125276039 isoform X2 [Megalobrama amblycephala]|uniref:uncharacterized protein LOC125276039 isoform X2 n=1 Tax=Megalobrama amblycephala TaxID=75352 RepID=UPI0020145644|nr:uncharacterized protein LOC125276039 isoform X2 [Megalobrama amblycephala]